MQTDSRLWYEQLLNLIEQLYQAKNPHVIGHAFFDDLSKLLAFDAAIFTPINWQTLELQEGFCYGDLSAKSSIHAPFDPLLFDPLCLTRLNKTVRLSDMLNAERALPEISRYPPQKAYQHAMGVVASCRQQPIAAIRFYRRGSAPDFSTQDLKLLDRLALHIANAVYFQDTTIAFEPLRETGLIVFDAQDNLLYKNEAIAKMLDGTTPEAVLQLVKEGHIWFKNGSELYRTEQIPLSPTSLLTLLTKGEDLSSKTITMPSLMSKNQPIAIISIEPFRRRHAIANRLKHSGLSPREIEVSLAIMRGLSNANIAKQLFIDEKTVKDHLQRIYAKIHIKTRTELISKMLGLDIELAQYEIPPSQDIS